MWKLYAGVILFAAPHLYSIQMPAARNALKERLGEGAFKGLYSLVSLAGLVLLAMAYLAGRSGPNSLAMFYEPWLDGRHAMMLLVFAGFVLIFANRSQGYIAKFTRNPFSWGVVLLSIGHLLVNGERAVVVIFGMLLILAVLDIVANERRGYRPAHLPKWSHDLRAVAVGIVLFLAFALGFHPYVLNIPVLG
jgi:uncharacterized membrane protein